MQQLIYKWQVYVKIVTNGENEQESQDKVKSWPYLNGEGMMAGSRDSVCQAYWDRWITIRGLWSTTPLAIQNA